MLFQLVALALGTLASEDLSCIAAGVLVAQAKLSLPLAIGACLAGIVVGDILLVGVGRLAGSRLLNWPVFTRRVSPAKLQQASDWLQRNGLRVVLASRFTPGMRLPVYVAAGMLRASAGKLLLWFILAAAIWTPALVGLSALLGRELIVSALATARYTVFASAAVAAVTYIAVRFSTRLFRWERRRRIIGAVLRIFQWEFWPAWAAYLPIVPYLLFLAVKHRSATLFTAANPGIPSGGFVGESKSEILSRLARSGSVPKFVLIESSAPSRSKAVMDFMAEADLAFPIVLKPDRGQRGKDVAIVSSVEDIEAYFAGNCEHVIAQEYVPGVEFGVFYARKPSERRGRILSVTEKQVPVLKGDGRSTLEHLILRDPRAVCLAPVYLRQHNDASTRIPYEGETLRLVEIGSHCRGMIFRDGSHLQTPELEARIEEISRTHTGFYFGRYDVRATSVEDLQAGRFQVIELNGVTGEPTHIYDPAVSLVNTYAALLRHWRLAFEIGAENRDRGLEPMLFGELCALVQRTMA